MQGRPCCSSSPISIHYVSPGEMYLLDYLLHHVKPVIGSIL